MILYTFYLLITIAAAPVCSMWVSAPPTTEQVKAACGQIDLARHDLRIEDAATGAVMCETEDTALTALPCGLPGPWHLYRLVIVKPEHEQLACAITSRTRPPSTYEIALACPPEAAEALAADRARLQLVNEETITDAPKCARPELATGAGMYDAPTSPADLATAQDLHLLAGRLIWAGRVLAECPTGAVTVALYATPCGMDAARAQALAMQNQHDQAIYDAATAEQVPARLLKAILLAESQAWPLWMATGEDGEIGPFQVTDAGLDTLLRYDPQLDPLYPARHPADQAARRAEIRAALECANCTLEQAAEHMAAHLPLYARLLAAYRCQAQSASHQDNPQAAWRNAAALWNIKYQELLP